MYKNHPHTPRKKNSRKNYLRPYGGDVYKGVCSCHIGMSSLRGSINHGNNTWRIAERKARRKRARQEAQKTIFQELADMIVYTWNGVSNKVSYLYDQDEPDVFSYYEWEIVEYNGNLLRIPTGV